MLVYYGQRSSFCPLYNPVLNIHFMWLHDFNSIGGACTNWQIKMLPVCCLKCSEKFFFASRSMLGQYAQPNTDD